ncbi:MAG: hypothetical protein AAGI53_03180 [Planctomycetota bacterium]
MHTFAHAVAPLALAFAAGTAAAHTPIAADSPDGDLPALVYDARPAIASAAVSGAPWELRRSTLPATFFASGEQAEGDGPADVVFTPDGSTIVIAHRESQNLILWDAATLDFAGEVRLDGFPQALAISPDGSKAVVGSLVTNTVSIVNMQTLVVEATIPVGLNPGAVRVMPSSDLAVVGIAGDSQIAVIDLTTDTVVRTIDDIGYTQLFGVAPETSGVNLQYSKFDVIDDDRVLNVDRFGQRAQFVNVRNGTVNNVAIPSDGSGLSISGDGTAAAISHTGSTRRITMLDTALELVSSALFAPEDLRGDVVLDETGSRGFVVVSNATRSFVVGSGSFGPQLNTASLNGLVRNFDGTRAYGIGFNGPVFNFATGSLLGFSNSTVSTDFGAASPTEDIAVACSTTFGDDLVVSEIDASPRLAAFQLSGPLPEGDRTRTVAVSMDGSIVAGVSILSDTVSIVDAEIGLKSFDARTGQRPSGVGVSPDGSKVVVSNLDSTFATVVDVTSGTSTNVNISRRGSQVEISPDGQFAYIPVVADGDGVWRINLDTNSVQGPRITTGNMGGVGYQYSQSSGIDLSPDGSLLAVAGSFTDNVSLIDTANWVDLGDTLVGDFPSYVAFNPDGTRLAVSNRNDDSVTVLDTTTIPPTTVSTLFVGDQPGELAWADDGRLFVLAFADDAIWIFSPGGTIDDVIGLNNTVVGMHVDDDANRLYVATSTASISLGGAIGFAIEQAGELVAYHLDTYAIAQTTELGSGPAALDVASDGSVAAVAAILDAGTVITGLQEGCNAADIAFPFGIVDLSDVDAFIEAFAVGGAVSDLVPPFGITDLSDVNAFIEAFLAGCP